uniref:DISC1 scaffold protein n=1 Tax=Cyprinodon variegatus TaxID=28743 RepID=A0A3Q2CC12_CYPVA
HSSSQTSRNCTSAKQRCFSGGGKASGTAGNSGRKRLHRRPGYMRGEQARLQCTALAQEDEEEEEEESIACIRKGKSGRRTDVTEATTVQVLSQTPAVKMSLMNNQRYTKSTGSHSKNGPGSVNGVQNPAGHLVQSSPSQNELYPSLQSSSQDSFNSSFSFIQQSLSCIQRTEPEATSQPANFEKRGEVSTCKHIPLKQSSPTQSLPPSAPGSQFHREEQSCAGRSCRDSLSGGKEEIPHLLNCESQPLDIEVISSLSVDSDTASASSVTSGYESATPASEQGWEIMVKKYEGVLQDCLQNNRAYTKIESMMMKLQRLQQKAILDDDYDAAERFGKKLEELCRERGSLKLGLPSMQPSVALFLERLTKVVHSALQRADCSQCRLVTPKDTHDFPFRGSEGQQLHINILQEQEQALNLSIKEATAKVVMSQRLGSSLRRKVSETETQLLTLHEAKLAAISGNDFGCAKELKAEMKAVYLERDRLEALAKRLHNLSSGSSQELSRMKEQRQQLRQELEEREALHERGGGETVHGGEK